ncbi:hypothetical protein HG536_0H00620 [Torulaspora globosa]|uniref:Uncharacterized protein n=1 Tax=Torulaspora globosa TaxID=48254 RepID=A0A7G3ZMF1_9SACH|nr:uncharacterized protein HG536_0H00620 [Torulaspora globosa]QLL34687.1 hypothetical protein HG536_0H00620 [Torulaspora globosa]
MAKTLAQGRKPGSGRKPGKGKTLREGRKPGSGRRRRLDEPDRAVRSKSQDAISSRDLEAVDALRELNNSPPQQQLPQQKLQYPQQLSREAPDTTSAQAVSLVAQNQQLSNAAAGVPGAFAFQSVGPYMVSPQYMHTAAGVSSPLLVPLARGGCPAESATGSSSAVLENSRGSSGDDATGTVLVHTST